MKRFTVLLGAVATLALIASTTIAEQSKTGPQIAGYRRDGTGIFPGIKPPKKDLKQEWVVKLPAWGNSSPIVVEDKVFLTVDITKKHRYFPALLCLDAKTGKTLWEKPLDHTAALPEELREAVRKKWHGQQKPEKDADLKDAGITKDNFTKSIPNAIGEAYATPVSDGKHVWSVTAWGGYFCHDLRGNLKWLAFDKSENTGEYCRNGRSPLLWKNLLISDITNRVRAFDADTGELVWASDAPANKDKHGNFMGGGVHSIVSPMVMTVDGNDILLAAGVNAYELPGGKRLKVEGWKDYGMQTLVKHDEPDVVFFCGAGEHCGWTRKGKLPEGPNPPAAVRFTRDDDTLKAKVLWHGGDLGKQRGIWGNNSPWMTVYKGRFYHRQGHILDAMTGKFIARGGRYDHKAPQTDHYSLIADEHIYGLTKHGNLSVYALDGRKVSELKVERPGSRGKRARITRADGPAFVLADGAIFVRSDGYLHRIIGD